MLSEKVSEFPEPAFVEVGRSECPVNRLALLPLLPLYVMVTSWFASCRWTFQVLGFSSRDLAIKENSNDDDRSRPIADLSES